MSKCAFALFSVESIVQRDALYTIYRRALLNAHMCVATHTYIYEAFYPRIEANS